MTKDKPHTYVLYAHGKDLDHVEEIAEILEELGIHLLAVTNYDFFVKNMEKNIPKA